MNISDGFQIFEPRIFVPWGLDFVALEKLLSSVSSLKKITTGYYTIEEEPLEGLQCPLGFHLHETGRLNRLEFFRKDYSDQQLSFKGFQRSFETIFGKPNHKTPGSVGFPSYTWNLKDVTISHYVFNRFGPEEHMEISKR
jgi:hypothetical protein